VERKSGSVLNGIIGFDQPTGIWKWQRRESCPSNKWVEHRQHEETIQEALIIAIEPF
jgi:hypothetical protein